METSFLRCAAFRWSSSDLTSVLSGRRLGSALTASYPKWKGPSLMVGDSALIRWLV